MDVLPTAIGAALGATGSFRRRGERSDGRQGPVAAEGNLGTMGETRDLRHGGGARGS